MTVTGQRNLAVVSSEDGPILDFVREHLKEIRNSMSYLQIAGGDGVNAVACLRVEQARDARLAFSSFAGDDGGAAEGR
jgi:hypothetical protein